MDKKDPTFKKLLAENKELVRLYEEHLKYEKQLEELDKALYLSAEQELHRKTLQKLKLSGKDQMMLIVESAQKV